MKLLKAAARRLLPIASLCSIFVLSNQIAFSQYVCQLNGAQIVQTGSLTAGDPVQSGRVVRAGVPSTCTGKSNTLQNSTGVVHDAYTYTSPVTGCATVDLNATTCGGATTQAVAYSSFDPASPAANVIGDFGFSTTGNASFSFPVTAGQNYTVVVHDILESPNALCTSYSFTVTYRTGCRLAGFDKTNDGKADPTFFRPSDGTWNILNSAGGSSSFRFGTNGDIPTAGDYTGDGQTDLSVYRPSTNTWFYSSSQTDPQSAVNSVRWGVAGDIPVPGDYDRDGKTDVAVWRPSNGFWYALRSSDQTLLAVNWGTNGDVPVTGDFDGDLAADFGVVRPNEVGVTPNYQWYILETNFNAGFFLSSRFGTAGDRIAPGDFDGNGKTDIAVYRPSDGTWYYLPSSRNDLATTAVSSLRWGTTGDIPQPADYDGDKRTDFAVFRPSMGIWYILNSHNGAYDTISSPTWGTSTDQPATSPYLISNP
ncbi:MAG: VCBS repeat-containing protein [Acidobacteriota bacterium]